MAIFSYAKTIKGGWSVITVKGYKYITLNLPDVCQLEQCPIVQLPAIHDRIDAIYIQAREKVATLKLRVGELLLTFVKEFRAQTETTKQVGGIENHNECVSNLIAAAVLPRHLNELILETIGGDRANTAALLGIRGCESIGVAGATDAGFNLPTDPLMEALRQHMQGVAQAQHRVFVAGSGGTVQQTSFENFIDRLTAQIDANETTRGEEDDDQIDEGVRGPRAFREDHTGVTG